jgi:autotransporter-associated beta strand protein
MHQSSLKHIKMKLHSLASPYLFFNKILSNEKLDFNLLPAKAACSISQSIAPVYKHAGNLRESFSTIVYSNIFDPTTSYFQRGKFFLSLATIGLIAASTDSRAGDCLSTLNPLGGACDYYITAPVSTIVNLGTIGIGFEDYPIQNNSSLGTLTNAGAINDSSSPGYGIYNNPYTSASLNTLNNGQGGDGLSLVTKKLAYFGNLPLNYNIIVNSTSNYGQLSIANNHTSGSMVFNIYGYTGQTLTTGVSASVLTVNRYLNVLMGFNTLSDVSGTTGIYGEYKYSLTAGTGAGNWDLDVTALSNIVATNNRTTNNVNGYNLLSNSAVGSTFVNRFDGGTLRVDVANANSSSNFSITANKGTIDQYGNNATLSGVITDDGASHGRLIVTNSNGTSGNVALTNTGNTYSGGTEVQAGATLSIADARAIGSGGLDLVGSPTVPATLQTTSDMTISAPITVAGDPVFNVAAGTILTISSPIADGASAGDVVADGGGTLALTAANTYTGQTIINAGATLALNGSGAIAASRAVTNNGVLNIAGKTTNVALGGTYTQGSTGTLSMNFAPSNNQQLNVTGAASLGGTLTLTPSAGTYTAGRYTLLTASSVTGTFQTFNANLAGLTSMNYSLNYDPTNVFLDLTLNGPSAANTQDALTQSAAALRSVFNQQSSMVNNSLHYDCTVFAENGVCVSGGGRFATTNSITGDQTSTLLVAAYKALSNMRVGMFIDQNVPTANSTGITLDKNPMYGVFGVWNQNPDAMGYEVRLSTSYANQNISQTRNVVGTSEAGVGSASLTSQATSGVVSYAMPLTDSTWIASPYLGVRKTKINRGAYTETSAVATPLTYSYLTQDITTALAGVRTSKKFSDNVYVTGSVGVEQNVGSNISTLDATGVTGLTATDFSANYAKTRPVASAGASYAIDKNQRISLNAMYRREAFQSSGSTTALLMYQVGL